VTDDVIAHRSDRIHRARAVGSPSRLRDLRCMPSRLTPSRRSLTGELPTESRAMATRSTFQRLTPNLTPAVWNASERAERTDPDCTSG